MEIRKETTKACDHIPPLRQNGNNKKTQLVGMFQNVSTTTPQVAQSDNNKNATPHGLPQRLPLSRKQPAGLPSTLRRACTLAGARRGWLVCSFLAAWFVTLLCGQLRVTSMSRAKGSRQPSRRLSNLVLHDLSVFGSQNKIFNTLPRPLKTARTVTYITVRILTAPRLSALFFAGFWALRFLRFHFASPGGSPAQSPPLGTSCGLAQQSNRRQ